MANVFDTAKYISESNSFDVEKGALLLLPAIKKDSNIRHYSDNFFNN